jgi:N-acetylmuramoyl-L-alanine amidase
MPAAAVYLLKCVACSAILYTYYRLAFYNRGNHQWNRLYLLASVVTAIFLPLLRIYIPAAAISDSVQQIDLLNIIESDNYEEEVSTAHPVNSISFEYIIAIVYMAVSAGMLFHLMRSLFNLYTLYRLSLKQEHEGVEVIITNETTSPFSFMRKIFWNKNFEIESGIGRNIFRHELEHVRQLHSIDRLCMSVVLVVFWANPIFWLIRREMILVHEFMADEKSIADNDVQAFSKMIILSAYPTNKVGFTSTFFNSSIKRRLAMLTTFRNSRASHFAKWLMLPLLVILIAGFSFRKKDLNNSNIQDFILVIDAGHGGERSGVVAADGTTEKELNLALANQIRLANTNDRLKIVLTRENDQDIPLRQRVERARQLRANAFISVHINNAIPAQSGIQLLMTRNATELAPKSQLLGTLVSQELAKVFKVDGELQKGAEKGVWVLDAPEINYPSLLIEFGNINNPSDLEFLKSEVNQQKLAKQLLNAVAQFADGQAKK